MGPRGSQPRQPMGATEGGTDHSWRRGRLVEATAEERACGEVSTSQHVWV